MAATRLVRAGRVGSSALMTLMMAMIALPLAAVAGEDVLFPEPLHLTREVHDSLSGSSGIVDEYCLGDRIVSIRGERTAVADYRAATLTEIDFAAGTHSVTPFAKLAAARNEIAATKGSAEVPEWVLQRGASRRVGPRSGELVEVSRGSDGERRSISVVLSHDPELRRAAVEALLGIGYPNRHDSIAEGLAYALRPQREQRQIASEADMREPMLGVPLEQRIRIESSGQVIETRSVIVRIGREVPPPERIAIPIGSQLVEAKDLIAQRLGREIDEGVPNP